MRPTVTSIAVTLSDGRTLTLDATQLEGLFWSDRTVNQMLAPFYNDFTMHITPEHLADAPAALPLLNGQSSTQITPELVGQMWNQPDANGNLPAFVVKVPVCISSPRY